MLLLVIKQKLIKKKEGRNFQLRGKKTTNIHIANSSMSFVGKKLYQLVFWNFVNLKVLRLR